MPDSPEYSRYKLFKVMAARFLRLNIANKMFLGFSPLLILLGGISLFALTNLNQLNRLNESILEIDIPAQQTVEKMREIILVQESFIRRFMLLKDEEMLKIYGNKGAEFISMLNLLKNLPQERGFPIQELEEAYNDYSSSLLAGIKSQLDNPTGTAEFNKELRDRQFALIKLLKRISTEAIRDQNEKTGITASIGKGTFNVALILCIVGLLLSVSAAAIVTNNIVKAVRKLQLATELIARGEFDHRPDIQNKDELGDLADAFVMMAARLKKLEEMYLDASPLTRMPGGIAVENVLKKKIESGRPLAFCLMDLDNFKSYNDHYGYSKGNTMIQRTAAIIEEVVAEHGTDEDFCGHIGGDDFVVITDPDHYQRICQEIIAAFDAGVPEFYNKDDQNRGFIKGENRQGQSVLFPLASISIAVVTDTHRRLENHIQVGEIAAEIKEHAKSIRGSSLVIDQRHQTTSEDGGKLLNFPKAEKTHG